MASTSNIFQGITNVFSRFRRSDISGYLVIIFGNLVGTPSANFDMANHWLNKPETFFSPSHLGVYTGVAIVIFGSIWVLRNAYSQQSNYENESHKHKSFLRNHLAPHRWFFHSESLSLPTKLIFYGVIISFLAGPFDLAWHTLFGLDGLLSPSHATLRIGDALSAIGTLLGIISTHPIMGSTMRSKQYYSIYPILIIVSILPVIYSARGFISMVTLPFSNTINFQWNLDPIAAAVIATLGYPFVISLFLYLSFRLANLNVNGSTGEKGSRTKVRGSRIKFGVLTTTGIALIATMIFTVILPNKYLHATIPLYLVNLIPIVTADILLTMAYANNLGNSLSKRTAIITAGAILGLTFFTLQYPFITYTYNQVLENPQVIGPTNVHVVYFKMLNIVPLIIPPSIIMGILGVFVGSNLISRYVPQKIVRSNSRTA
jgi:hypothetical protein